MHRKTTSSNKQVQQFAGYMIKAPKSIMFLHRSNEEPQKEIGKTRPLAIVSKIIKYLERHLNKEVKDLCVKIYNILLK
jgi:hypothetical protein